MEYLNVKDILFFNIEKYSLFKYFWNMFKMMDTCMTFGAWQQQQCNKLINRERNTKWELRNDLVGNPHCSCMGNPLPRVNSSINPNRWFILSTCAKLDSVWIDFITTQILVRNLFWYPNNVFCLLHLKGIQGTVLIRVADLHFRHDFRVTGNKSVHPTVNLKRFIKTFLDPWTHETYITHFVLN